MKECRTSYLQSPFFYILHYACLDSTYFCHNWPPSVTGQVMLISRHITMQMHPFVGFSLVFCTLPNTAVMTERSRHSWVSKGALLSTSLLREIHEPSNQPSKHHTNQQTKHIFKEPEMVSLAGRIASTVDFIGIKVQFLAVARYLSRIQSIQTSCGAQPPIQWFLWAIYPWVKQPGDA